MKNGALKKEGKIRNPHFYGGQGENQSCNDCCSDSLEAA